MHNSFLSPTSWPAPFLPVSQRQRGREWEERAFRSVGDLCTRMTRRAGFWSGEREQDLRGPFFRSDITNRLYLLLLHVLLCSILLAAINFVLLPNERLYGHVLRINFIPTPSSIAACRPTNFNLERNLFSGREGRRVMRETVRETIVASLKINICSYAPTKNLFSFTNTRTPRHQ